MLYLKNALGGFSRSVTDTARHAFAGAGGVARWRKLALYVVMFALPGGSIAVVLFAWADRRRALRSAGGGGAAASAASVTLGASVTPGTSVAPGASVTSAASFAGAQPCTGAQPACRAACAAPQAQGRKTAAADRATTPAR